MWPLRSEQASLQMRLCINFEIKITLKSLIQVKLNTVKLQAVGRSTIQFWEPIQSTAGDFMVSKCGAILI
jgi:hypothetical protein